MNGSKEPLLLNDYYESGKLLLSELEDPSKAVYSQDEIDKTAFSFLEDIG